MLHNENRIDPRIKRTRQLIKQAFFELLQKRHYQDITVQDIAETAGINRATFYAHFVDKLALMNYAMREMFQEALDSYLPPNPSLTPANLRLLIVATCNFMAQSLNHCSPVRDNVQPLIEAE